MTTLSRRALLGLVASAGVAAALSAKAQGLGAAWSRPDPNDSSRWLYLKPAEVAFLVAAVDRFIPEDDFPSASQAGVVDFIDLQLATDWGKGANLFLQGPFRPETAAEGQGYQLPYTPAELYRHALDGITTALPGPFDEMSGADQDAFLKRLENGETDAGDIPGATFFDLLLQNTVEGFLADPIHGGNFSMAGWLMLGFPGADAYYTSLVDNFGMEFFKAPSGVSLPAGAGAPRPAPKPFRQMTLNRDPQARRAEGVGTDASTNGGTQ